MKKTLLKYGIVGVVLYCSIAFAASGESLSMEVSSMTPPVIFSEELTQNYGASIGEVEAQLYSESGLGFGDYVNFTYVAQTADNTFMGFNLTNDWITDEETGEYKSVAYMDLVFITSSDDVVTIPDYLKIGDESYPVERISTFGDIKILTIPSTVNRISIYYGDLSNLESVYMLGAPPILANDDYFKRIKVYICDKAYFTNYLTHYQYEYSNIFQYGWDYDWIAVNVERPGEFAETYLTQNNYDWEAGQYVKIVGEINEFDLKAIKNLTYLVKLDLEETTISNIPENFLWGLKSLIEIRFPSTLKDIEKGAFFGCSHLQSVFSNGLSTIDSDVFSYCGSLSHIDLKGVKVIGYSAFLNCGLLDDVDLSSVNYIGHRAFGGCRSLKNINLTNAKVIGDIPYEYNRPYGGAFDDCTSLCTVVLGSNLQSINQGCFRNTAITQIKLPTGITSIPLEAFEGCSLLTRVDFPQNLSSIEALAFYGCKSLEEVNIPATVTSIGARAFYNTGIKKFVCYASVPPKADGSFIGEDMDFSRTYLFVPPFSKDIYRNTDYWSVFSLMHSIEEQIDLLYIDRPLTINLEEEDNYVVSNKPKIILGFNALPGPWIPADTPVGQLTAKGNGTLSAGQMIINASLGSRYISSSTHCPTLINYADKMRADSITINMSLYNSNGSGEWHFISLPFDVKVSEIIPGEDTYWVIRRYDAIARAAGNTSETWRTLTNDDVMEAGQGYILSAFGGKKYEGDEYSSSYVENPCLTFLSGNSLTKNNMFRSTDVVVPLKEYSSEFAHNRSWNFIGNPYPCYFNMHYLNEEFVSPITVWNGGAYVAYSPVDDDIVLSPYESFFVQCPLDAKEITFKEEGRMHSDEGVKLYKAPSRDNSIVSLEERNVFNFTISNESYSDRARIVLNPDASMGYELGRDASKFFADDSNNAQVYVAADVMYSISERPVNDGAAKIGVRTSQEGVYTLSLSGRYSSEWRVLLTDNMTGNNIDLTENDYQFTAFKGDVANRFSIKFLLESQSGIESVLEDFEEDSNVTVTTMNGIVVYSGSLKEISVPIGGIYLISDGQKTRKVILRKI